MASAAGDDWATIVSKRSLAKFNRRGSTVTDFDRVIPISQPISNQTQIPQPSPAATERQLQRCTRSIPYCQRTVHDARPWPASFRLPMLQANLSHLPLDVTRTSPTRRPAGASRRVIAKVEWHPGELYPRVGFVVTNMSRPAERVVAFYNKRGTAEQWIKEGKGAIKWTRLSCRTFAANAVRLQLHALAYNLGNFLRTLATPEPIKDWSLTSL